MILLAACRASCATKIELLSVSHSDELLLDSDLNSIKKLRPNYGKEIIMCDS